MSTTAPDAFDSAILPVDWPAMARRGADGELRDGYFRVVAVPADYALTDDVLLTDAAGRNYLLSHSDDRPTPLEDTLANSLGMFFEPSQDYSWHTVSELRRLIYGIEEFAGTR